MKRLSDHRCPLTGAHRRMEGFQRRLVAYNLRLGNGAIEFDLDGQRQGQCPELDGGMMLRFPAAPFPHANTFGKGFRAAHLGL